MKLIVPFEFRKPDTRPYPGDNTPDFEYWYSVNYTPSDVRIYLPVLWTSFYKEADFGNNQVKIRKLQFYLNTLDRRLKYYAVIQYDCGLLNSLAHLDCKVFSMSGKPMDYPLPLICQPHKYKAPEYQQKDFLINFIGKNTHPIRNEIFKIRKPGWYIDETHHKLDFYCRTIAASTFTLCPRGFGPASFRVCESLQYGSIPVYLSDEFVEAHNVPFEEYGIKVNTLDGLEEKLLSCDVKKLQLAGKYFYENYFTFESNKKLIEENL